MMSDKEDKEDETGNSGFQEALHIAIAARGGVVKIPAGVTVLDALVNMLEVERLRAERAVMRPMIEGLSAELPDWDYVVELHERAKRFVEQFPDA